MPVGITTAYDLNVGIRVNIDELIYMVSAIDSPMLTGVDSDGLSLVGTDTVDQIEFTWMHEEILTPRSTVKAVPATPTAADTALNVGAGDRLKFSTGDILRLVKATASEYVRVTGYAADPAVLTIARGFDGTTAIVQAVGDKVIGLGTSLPEGTDPEQARTADRAPSSNFTQIFGPTLVHMSRTEQKVNKYGVADEFTHQLMNRMRENVIMREQAALYGRKYSSAVSKIRTTGGLLQYVTDNVNTTATQLTVVTIEAAQQLLYNKGGRAATLMANPAALVQLNDVAGSSRVRQDFADSRRGLTRVMSVETEFGTMTVARNRWLEPSDAVLFNRETVTRRVLDPLQAERLAKTGDSDKVQIVCEEGWQIKGQQHMAKFSGLAYSSGY